MANMDIMKLLAAREAAVGLDDVADLLAQGPPVRPEAEIDRFWAWIEEESPAIGTASLEGMLHHIQSFWDKRDEPNVVLLRYEDMQADLEGEMRRLAGRLAVDVPEDLWPELVEAATFHNMRARADVTAPEVRESLWHDNKQFFHRGTCGQWRALLDDDGVARYQRRLRELADPELVAWVHGAADEPE
jgi:hypothetical protein